MAGPLLPGPSLYEWARTVARDPAGHEAAMLAEARRLGQDDYPTRSFYGRYLTWVYRRLVGRAPGNVAVHPHATRALALDDAAGGRQRIARDGGEDVEAVTLRRSLLTSGGHPRLKVMHPLPRCAELAADLDGTRYNGYWAQAANGVPVRMALLGLMFSTW